MEVQTITTILGWYAMISKNLMGSEELFKLIIKDLSMASLNMDICMDL